MGVKLRNKDPIFQCWRVAAIYRCVLRYGKGRDWALARLRDLDATGRKDHMVDVWFLGAENEGRVDTMTDTAEIALLAA